jgi:hypothetical protein
MVKKGRTNYSFHTEITQRKENKRKSRKAAAAAKREI